MVSLFKEMAKRRLYSRAKNLSKIKRPLDMLGGEFTPIMEHDWKVYLITRSVISKFTSRRGGERG